MGMTATERLRAMLDERGVEWTENDGGCHKQTDWPFNGELMAEFNEWEDGTTRFDCDTWCFSPEQAIDATLGVGTCHEAAFCTCSECGASLDGIYGRYCPNCGRRVVEVAE